MRIFRPYLLYNQMRLYDELRVGNVHEAIQGKLGDDLRQPTNCQPKVENRVHGVIVNRAQTSIWPSSRVLGSWLFPLHVLYSSECAKEREIAWQFIITCAVTCNYFGLYFAVVKFCSVHSFLTCQLTLELQDIVVWAGSCEGQSIQPRHYIGG
jgi:hypothetical protein